VFFHVPDLRKIDTRSFLEALDELVLNTRLGQDLSSMRSSAASSLSFAKHPVQARNLEAVARCERLCSGSRRMAGSGP
jgi:hypothetical protein